MRPREESEDRAGMTALIAVIQMIRPAVVEIDGLLHQSKTERAGVEIDIAGGGAGDGGDVMDAVAHGNLRWVFLGGFRSAPQIDLKGRRGRLNSLQICKTYSALTLIALHNRKHQVAVTATSG